MLHTNIPMRFSGDPILTCQIKSWITDIIPDTNASVFGFNETSSPMTVSIDSMQKIWYAVRVIKKMKFKILKSQILLFSC